MNALVRRSEQGFESQVARGAAEGARVGNTEQANACFIYKLEHVLAVEGIERRMHDLENAGQKRGGFEGTHALTLKQVGERVDFVGQFSERVGCACAASTKRVVALAQ